MPRENDLEGVQDQGGKHGGQKGMPESGPGLRMVRIKASCAIKRGEEQPRDKERVQQVSRKDRGADPPGEKA